MTAEASRPTLIALIVACAFFMEVFDGAVIATALPRMAESFATDTIHLGIGITAYMIAQAAVIPASGWMAERYGTRSVFAVAIAVFTIASILCGISPGLEFFLAARVLQGSAAALMSPVGRLVVLRTTERAQLIHAMATLTWPALIAPVVGPPIGGFITTYASWHWIFFINLPIGIAGIALVLRYIPNHFAETQHRFDLRGFVVTALGLGTLIWGLQLIGSRDWTSATTLVAAGLVLSILAIRHARHHPAPLIALSAMRLPSFSVTVWGGTAQRIAISATPFLLPILFQTGFGYSAFGAGLFVLAYMVGNLGMKIFTTRILRRFGFRTVLLANGVLVVLSIAACAGLMPREALPVAAAILFVAGCARSMQFTAINTMAFAEVAPAERGAATTLSSVVQQIGLALGIAFGTIALQVALTLRGAASSDLTLADFRIAFLIVAAIGIAGIADFRRLAPDTGAEVSGHRPEAKAA